MPDEASPRRPQDPPWRSRTAHRSLDPAVALMLAEARNERGWTQIAAAVRSGVSRRMIGMLERGQRIPSTVLAEALIDGYELGDDAATMLRDVALPNVGRASPLRAGGLAPVDPGGVDSLAHARDAPPARPVGLIEQLTRPAERFARDEPADRMAVRQVRQSPFGAAS